MRRRTDQWTISLPPPLSKRAVRLARKESRTKSELVREALRDYIVRKGVVVEARRQLSANLEKQGIRTLEDIDRVVDEGRI